MSPDRAAKNAVQRMPAPSFLVALVGRAFYAHSTPEGVGVVGACPAWLAGRWRPVGPDGFEDEAVTVVPWVLAHGEELIQSAVRFL